MCNFKNDWRLWCVAPFVVNTLTCFVAALPLNNARGCVGQFFTVSVVLTLTALFFFIGRPLRWWFLNTTNGLSYGLQAVAMACKAVERTKSSQNILLVEMHIAQTLSAISCATSIIVLAAVIWELAKARKVVWGVYGTQQDDSIDNAFYTAWMRQEMELLSAALASRGDGPPPQPPHTSLMYYEMHNMESDLGEQ